MSNRSGREYAGYMRRISMRRMFGRIAGRYDLMNRLMTLGQDRRWRREAIRRLEIPPSALALDAGTGTGNIAFEILHTRADVRVVASDLTPEMIAVGKRHPGAENILWVIADAEHLPFAADAFDALISGFLLRNVADLERTLHEQRRVLRAQGRVVSLDTTPPRRSLLLPFLKFHLRVIIPLLGRIVAGDAEAYTYLPVSTEAFLEAGRLVERMCAAGFVEVGFVRRMLGTMAIHWGKKPEAG